MDIASRSGESADGVPAAGKAVRLDLNEQAYDLIKAQLLSRRLKGGEKVSLQRIADELGVSRTPVHHALMRLRQEDLVVSEPRGYVVRPITVEFMDEAYEARLVLELHAADVTVGKLAERELERLRMQAEGIRPPKRGHDISPQLDAKRRFHELQIDLAGNSVISGMYRRLFLHELGQRTIPILGVDIVGEWRAEINQIVDAYYEGDLPAARAALTAHLDSGRRRARRAIAEAGGAL